MEDGLIKDIRIDLMSRMVILEFQSNRTKIKGKMLWNDNINWDILKNQLCRFEIDEQNVTRLEIDGKDIMRNYVQTEKDNKFLDVPMQPSQLAYYAPKANKGEAQAPYNFVPLNPKVVEVPTIDEQIECAEDRKGKYDYIPSGNKYHKELYTGYIKSDIKTRTHLYIRDTYTREEEKKAAEVLEKCKTCSQGCEKCKLASQRVNPDFFSPGGRMRIPGSSLRGMIRNLVEIVSCSRMEYIDDRRLYYRRVAETAGRYSSRMLEHEDGSKPKTEAGWLVKDDNGSHFIIPPEKPQIYRLNAYPVKDIKDTGPIKWEFNEGKLEGFKFYPISFIPTDEAKHEHIKQTKKGPTILLRYALVENFSLEHSYEAGYEPGYVILSGSMGFDRQKNCKHMHPIIHPPKKQCADNEKIQISTKVIDEYKGDKNRTPNIDLLDELKKKDRVPCFYLRENGEVVAIGHTPLFRIPYNNRIKDHLPEDHKNNKKDFAKAIFGDASTHSGRVFFEDAICYSDLEQSTIISPSILSNPKPTTIQHYLEQGESEQGEKRRLADWDDMADKSNCVKSKGALRGYKLYWHRNNMEWREIAQYDRQHTVFRPVKPNTFFKSKVHFENLSKLELGALLFALALPNECCHKIGMGKPLGLGSIRIKSNLTLSARNDKDEGRYGRLFAGQEWHTANEPGEIDYFKDCFAKYMLEGINHNKVSTNPFEEYWNTERMKELETMLDYDNTKIKNWTDKTKYMTVKGFKDRPVLPLPIGFIERAKR